ncbi:hypothetical protein Emag_003820 [Eimeria magna]
MVEAALAEARRLPETFVISFEDLRQPLGDSSSSDSDIPAVTRGSQGKIASGTPDASQPQEGGMSNACLRLEDKFSRHIEVLKQMEEHQTHMESKVFALNEVARFHPLTHEDERSRDLIRPQSAAWVENQIMHVKLHGRQILRGIEDSLSVFDSELRNLQRKRSVIQEQLALAKLKQLEHHEELLVIGAMEPRSLKVQQDLLNERAECQRINEAITRLKASTRATSACIENCHVKSKPGNLNFASTDGEDERHPDDGSGEEDLPQQGSEDVVVDVCPLGCDMALYEALLELRDQKTANDAELVRYQRELDELKKLMHRQHLSRCKEVQLVRFGMSLTLEEVEAASKLAGRADKQARAQPIKPAFESDVEAVAYKQAATPWLQNSADDTYLDRGHHEEPAHQGEELGKRQAEIKRLQELIKPMQIQGEHIGPAVLPHRDSHPWSPSLP